MNAFLNTELLNLNRILTANSGAHVSINTIRKVDVLCYYRGTKQAFLNLGSLLISQTDGRLYLFNHKDELVGID